MSEPYTTHAWLDIFTSESDSDISRLGLWGDCILLMDDDGMGFALDLERLIGKHVKIVIEEVPVDQVRIWKTKREEGR